MAYDYEEEEKKTRGVHPHSPAPGASSRATSSGSSTELPAWTQGAGSRAHEGEPAVRKWLDENVKKLGTLTLPQLVQCVLDSVPGALKLSRVEVETIICEWATDHNIVILQTVPPPSAQSSTATGEKGHKKRDTKGK